MEKIVFQLIFAIIFINVMQDWAILFVVIGFVLITLISFKTNLFIYNFIIISLLLKSIVKAI